MQSCRVHWRLVQVRPLHRVTIRVHGWPICTREICQWILVSWSDRATRVEIWGRCLHNMWWWHTSTSMMVLLLLHKSTRWPARLLLLKSSLPLIHLLVVVESNRSLFRWSTQPVAFHFKILLRKLLHICLKHRGSLLLMLLLRSAIPTLSLVTSLLLLNPERQIRHVTVGCGEGGHRPVVDFRPDMIPYSHHLVF